VGNGKRVENVGNGKSIETEGNSKPIETVGNGKRFETVGNIETLHNDQNHQSLLFSIANSFNCWLLLVKIIPNPIGVFRLQ
jgi:hypothetical protein